MQAVELVERDLDRPTDEPPARRRTSRGWALVPVLVVVALVGTQLVVAARDRAAAAALAEVAKIPGVVRPVDADLRVLWRAQADTWAAIQSGIVVDGAMIGLEQSPDNAKALVAVDERTGVRRWTTPLADAHQVDHGADGGYSTVGGCAVDPGGTGRVACLVTDAFLAYRDTAVVYVPSTTSRLVVVDTGDGSVVAQRAAPSVVALTVLAGLAVTAEPGAGGAVVVTATDLLGGQERWRTAVPGSSGDGGSSDGSTSMFATADGLGVEAPGRRVTLLDGRGRVVRSELDGSLGYSADPGSATAAVVSGDEQGSPRTTIVGGGPDLELVGRPIRAAVDDGSVPDLVLMADSVVRAYDRSSGDVRWSIRHASAGGDAVILNGRVYVSTGGGVIAVDGRTGEELWQAPVAPGLTMGGLVTDGRHLLSSQQRPEGPGDVTSPDDRPGVGVLVAYRLDDGTDEWRVDLPAGVTGVGTRGRTLVGLGSTGAVLG